MRFLAGRLLLVLLLVVAAASAALVLARVAPGDLTSQLGTEASAQEIATTRARFDLDRSPAAQWALWAGRALRLDFGTSFLYNRPVAPVVGRAALNTAGLAAAALLLATLVGISLGIYTGSRRGWLAALVRGLSLACVSLPPLLTSLLLMFVAARTGWFPVGGMSSAAGASPSWGAWLADVAWHLPLPALALALPIAATFERLQAQSMADAVHQPFVLAAIARGVRPEAVILRHAWPVSLRPICAVYGLAIGTLLSGSFIVEYVTAWPGLGRLMYEALRARDVYLVAGCAAAGAAVLGIGMLVGDLLLMATEPRLREAPR